MDSDSFLSLFAGISPLSIPTGVIILVSVIIVLIVLGTFFIIRKKNPSLFSLKPTPFLDETLSADDLSEVLEITSDELPEKKEMIMGIVGLFKRSAVEIMTPRVAISGLNIKTPLKEVIDFVIELGYSRIPVYAENQDDIKGILYSKDLLPYIYKQSELDWPSLIRPPYFVPENKKIDDLLEDFRKNKIHMAVVVDEFGGTSGIVTMEDILEEIVGDFDDEHDKEEIKYVHLDEGSFIFDGKISLADFFRATQLDEKEFGELTEEADTLAGLILEIKADFPEENEWIHYNNYSFQVLDMDKKRIMKVKFVENEEN